MILNTDEYVFSHGVRPRGFGVWVVEVIGADNRGSYTMETFHITGTLTEVKVTAAREMKKISGVKSVIEIKIMP